MAHVDRVMFVLPRVLPHKDFSGVSFEERWAMLQAATATRFEAVVTDGGLFAEIARELKDSFGDGVELVFLCGRDAAERIVEWDYGEPGAFERMLENFSMLVACRNGGYEAPEHLRHRIGMLTLERACDEISATEVRARMKSGEPWEHLVPEEIHARVRKLYGS